MKLWEDREPNFLGVLDEVRRLLRRSRQRKKLVLLGAIAVTVAIGARDYAKQRFYTAEVMLSATEGEDTKDAVAHTTAKLSDYVYFAVFTDGTLKPLIEKYGWRPELEQINPKLRIDSFRDSIEVTIDKNGFALPRYQGTPPRDARIGISYRHSDPDTALEIARALGDLVITRDAENRKAQLESKRRTASEALSYAQTEYDRFKRQLIQANNGIEFGDPADLGKYRVMEVSATAGLLEAENRLKEARKDHEAAHMTSASDAQSLELRYDRVDWGIAKRRVNLTTAVLKTVIGTFIAVFMVLRLVVPTFDPVIYDDREIRRIGLKPLGQVRALRTAKRA